MHEQLLSDRRVLIVEDEMLVLMAIEDMLTDLGCTSVVTAGCIAKALELIAANAFDLATLDVNLNGERSDPVADALADRGVSFAFSTGYGENGVSKRHAGRPVLNKPFNVPQFTAVLTELMRLRDISTVAA